MPIRLVPPRAGKTPYWYARGTVLGVTLDRSTKAARRADAQAVVARWERQISDGTYLDAPTSAPTFLAAAVAYMHAGGERRYMRPLIDRLAETPIDAIDQIFIDQLAAEMHPTISAASRCRYVYTPVQAVIRHAGRQVSFRRPKLALGRTLTDHLTPDDARALVAAASAHDAEFGLLLTWLLQTGTRVGEALRLTWTDIIISDRVAFVRITKNGDPRTVRLRADLAAELARHALGTGAPPGGKVFRWRYGGALIDQLRRATLAVSGVAWRKRPQKGESYRWPPHRLQWVHFHTLRHTWATFMRRYGGADIQGLVATGNWRDARSAQRYAHVAAHEEWDRVERLPALKDAAK